MGRPKGSKNKPKGLGDTIEQITEVTGIKKTVQLFTPDGKDCGCDKRKEKLNKLFPYNKPKCFNEEQYNQWTNFKNRDNKNKVDYKDQQLIITLLRDILNMSVKACSSCGASTWKTWIDKIDKVYNEYENN